jgi:dipeptidase E
MQTTNDMPIVYPPSFKTLGILLRPQRTLFRRRPAIKTHGETRDNQNKRVSCLQHHPVLGLREGSWLKVDGDKIIVKGEFRQTFKQNQIAEELETGTDISYINNKPKTIKFRF